MASYATEHVKTLYAKMIAERDHVFNHLWSAAAMWTTALTLITNTHQELNTRKGILAETWRDAAGTAFIADIDRSLAALKTWMDNIGRNTPATTIRALFDSMMLGFETVESEYLAWFQADQQGNVDEANRRMHSRAAATAMDFIDYLYGVAASKMNESLGNDWPGLRASTARPGGPAGVTPASASPGTPSTPDPATALPGTETPDPATTNPQPTNTDETDPVSTALQKVPEVLSQLSQLAQSGQQLLSGLGSSAVPDPMTGLDPKHFDPVEVADYAAYEPIGGPTLSGVSPASGLGGGGLGGGGLPGGLPGGGLGVPVTALPSAAGALAQSAGGLLASGSAATSAGAGGMPPMMPPQAGAHGGARGGGIKPGAAEHPAARPRDRKAAGTPGVPAALRGRSGAGKPARPRAASEVPRLRPDVQPLDDELWLTDENPRPLRSRP
ncbi:hypothetical protein [Actinokineospora sp. HUAS TT18]|uniref:hypothetical protein n=1 Tax=Actinokineospora sp. HUAS TT18 TaxID=3447451 RepID=UPI003F523AD9